MQQMIVFGILRLQDTNDGNANYLSEAVQLGRVVGEYNERRLIEFILDHAPALEWTKGRFRKRKDCEATLTESKTPVMKWWKFKKAPKTVNLDVSKTLVSLDSRIKKARKEGRLISTPAEGALMEALSEYAEAAKAA
jgi:hypothetical protein